MLNFIININSGKGKGKKTLKKLEKFCSKNNVEYKVHKTNAPKHASEIAKSLSSFDKEETIIAVGGDGTFHEVINGINNFNNVKIGFIPSGRGNDFAKSANLSTKPIKALKDILKNEEKTIDYIQIGDIRSLNVAGTGLDVEVLERVAGKTGKITYLVSLLYCVKHFTPYNLDVTIDGTTINYPNCIMIGVCNGTCIGGGMKISPHSDLSDNKLNVIIIQMPKDGKLMKALYSFLPGKHIDKEFTTEIICDSVKITSKDNYPLQLDGEIYKDLEFDCKLIKNGIRTFKTNL